ncbi:MAG: ParB/RepB/Spo0J family partition protein [Bacteroidales bacterium]|nr:ParB/RepB/Spo0J family partition protein [Bacteroidales bacterium]
MAKQEHGLGRGLSALLGADPKPESIDRKPVGYINKETVKVNVQAAQKPQADIVKVPIDLVEPNPYQPRMSFDVEALEELAESIRTLGLIQPITVRRKADGKFQIISGERRFRASRLAGMDSVPAYVKDTTDQGMLEMAIVENIQRQDLDPIEVALSYQRLIDECQLTQEQMALRVGKKRASVSNSLRLLRLPAKVQHDIKVGLVSVGHAKVLLSVDDAQTQEDLCDRILQEGLSVRALEELVAKMKEPARKEGKKVVATPELPERYYKMIEIVGKYFDNNISVKRSDNGKGTMTVRFNSDEQVAAFLSALEKTDL